MKLYWYSFKENKVMSGILDESKLEFDGHRYSYGSNTYYCSLAEARTMAITGVEFEKLRVCKEVKEYSDKITELQKKFDYFNDLVKRIKNYKDNTKCQSRFVVEGQYGEAGNSWITISRHKTLKQAANVYDSIKNSGGQYPLQFRISQEIIK